MEIQVDGEPLHPDAIPEADLNYSNCLIEADGGLDTGDIESLKFLLRGFISDSKLQKLTRGIDIFNELQYVGKIIIGNDGKENLELLEECFYRIHRKDLLRRIARDPAIVERRIKRMEEEIRNGTDTPLVNSSYILLPYRVMLFEIGEDIDEEEFKSALFALSSLVPRGQLTKMKSIFDLFLFLEKKDELSAVRVDVLYKVLKSIDRADLIPKVEAFDGRTKIQIRSPPVPTEPSRMEVDPAVPPGISQTGPPQSPLSAGTVSGGSFDNMREQIRTLPRPPLNQNSLILIASAVAKSPEWKDIFPYLGVENQDIQRMLNDQQIMPAVRILKLLQHWQRDIMQNNDSCRVTLIGVFQKFGMTEALGVLGATVQDEQEPPSENEAVHPAPGPILHTPEHPRPEPLPRVGARNWSETETQTSLMYLPSGGVFPVKNQNHENVSVSNVEAQVTGEDLLRATHESENNYAQSERVNRQDENLEQAMRRANIDDEMELPTYRMDRKPRGMALIINNMNFFKVPNDPDSKEMPNRTGTDLDAEKLFYIFQKLEFRVERHDNLEDYAMNRVLVEASFKDHSDYDCFVCCILSHGVLQNIYGTNGRLVRISELTGIFRSGKCPSLAGKPKLFFIQACQGREKQGGIEIETDSDLEADTGRNLQMIPDEADFVLGCATVPGYVSYRSRTQGSWFVNKLVETLDKFAYRYDLLSILVKVNEEVGKANARLEGGLYKQIPAPLVTLRKKLFFR